MTTSACTPVETASLYVSVELSKRCWLTAALLPGSERVSLRSVASGDSPALLSHLAKLKGRAEAANGSAVRVRVCYEVGYDGFWLARLLLAEGIDAYVFDPASFLVSRRGKHVKTDRLDAEAMVWILKAHVAGDRTVCRAVRVPTPEEEDAKRIMRERGQLIAERTSHIARVRSLLALHGVRAVKAIWGGDALGQFDDMQTGDGRPLPPHLRREIERELGRLALINEQLKVLEKERAETLAAPDTHFPAPQKAAALERLKGIGRGSATMLTAEIFHRPFENRRQLTAFLGLAPSPYSSGDVERDQGISKAGNKKARVLLVELAWCWLRYQPDSALTHWYRERFIGRGKRAVKVGIVALARKLLIALWRYVETGLVPHGAELRPAA